MNHGPLTQCLTGLALTLVLVVVSCSADPGVDQLSVPAPTITPVAAASAATEVPVVEAPTAIPAPPPATPVPTPSPIPTVTPSPTLIPPEPTVPIVSDEVPSTQELIDIGLTQAQAECFITTIDPDGTGRVQDAELFLEALGNCT